MVQYIRLKFMNIKGYTSFIQFDLGVKNNLYFTMFFTIKCKANKMIEQ